MSLEANSSVESTDTGPSTIKVMEAARKHAGSGDARRKRLAHRVVAHLRTRTYGELFLLAKISVVGVVTAVPLILTAIVVSKSVAENSVVLTALQVPRSFEAAGFNPETATQRLLDEIAVLNRRSRAAKPRTALSDTQILDTLSSIDTPAGTLDLKSFKSLVQRVIGKTIIDVSGDITSRKEGDREIYRLRLRQTPGRQVLIDVESSLGPDDLFKTAALNLLERVDPEIAAGIYYRDMGDAATALRLIAVALADHPVDEKYAVNLKSYILAAQGKLDEAMRASDRAREIDPAFGAGYNSQANVLRLQKEYAEASVAARRAIELDPTADWGPERLGLVLKDMGNSQAAIDAFKASLKLNSHYWPSYIDIALTLRDMGRWDESNEVLFEATSIIPDSAPLHFVYGENLRSTAHKREGAEELGKAVALQPRSLKYQLGLAEALIADGKLQEVSPLVAGIRARIASGERITPDLRAKADALLVRVDAVAKSAE